MSEKFYWELVEDDDDFGFDQMIMTSTFHANGFPLNPSLADADVLVVREFSLDQCHRWWFHSKLPPPLQKFRQPRILHSFSSCQCHQICWVDFSVQNKYYFNSLPDQSIDTSKCFWQKHPTLQLTMLAFSILVCHLQWTKCNLWVWSQVQLASG